GDDRGDPEGDASRDRLDGLARLRVASAGGPEDLGGARRPADASAASRDQHAVGPERRLERAAAAVGPVVRIRRRERQVGDLPRGAVRALEQLAPDHDAEPHARTYVEED